MYMSQPEVGFGTILYETAPEDGVATITLNRPEVINVFDRQMCEEMCDVWHLIKDLSLIHI